MLERQSWEHHGENLKVGEHARVNHDCGEGRTLVVNREHDRLWAWCHRCNDHGFIPIEESLADRLARLSRQGEADRSIIGEEPPTPADYSVDNWPGAYRLWLHRAGLGRAEIGTLGAYYHPESDRVVVPSPCGLYWQARSQTRQPKWLGPSVKPARTLPRWGQADRITLTEDMLSAFKVGMAGHEGVAILGTRVSDYLLSLLLQRGQPVNLWTDPDAAGRKAAARYLRQLRAYGLEVRDIQSDRDPKLLHTQAIKDTLR